MNQMIGCAVEQRADEFGMSMWTLWVCRAAEDGQGMVGDWLVVLFGSGGKF